MNCEISLVINKDGKKEIIVIGNSPTPIASMNDVKKLLYSMSKEELDGILKSLPSIDEIGSMDIADISENSVGVHTPTDLITTLSSDNQTLLYKLKLDKKTLDSNIIISGFGEAGVKTQFTNGHIFLNLNYMYDNDNKVMALFETALYLTSPDTYEKNVADLLSTEVSAEAKLKIISSAFKINGKEYDFEYIKSIYDFAAIKNAGQYYNTIDVINYDENTFEFKQRFNINTVNTRREFNYTLLEPISIESLRRGDLVLVEFLDGSTTKSGVAYPKTKYEVFFDYFVDEQGQTIIKTFSPSVGPGINNRLVSSEIVKARRYTPEKITAFSKLEGVVVKTTDKFFALNQEYTYNLIKNEGVKVNGLSILSLEGSTITVEGNKTIRLSEVKTITISRNSISVNKNTDLAAFQNITAVGFKVDHIPYNTKVILEDTNAEGNVLYKEGIIIGKGRHEGLFVEELLCLTTNSENKPVVEKILSSKITHIIPDNFALVEPTTKIRLDSVIKQLYNSNDSSEFISNKNGALLQFDYSIEQVNDHTSFQKGDIIFDFTTRRYYKVLESTALATIVATDLGNSPQYLDLPQIVRKNSIVFTKKPVNTTFALASIIKNRFKIDSIANPQQVTADENQVFESIQLEGVFKKANGFVFPISKTEWKQIKAGEKHPIYEESDENITSDFKNLLEVRYQKQIGLKAPLYIYRYIKSGVKLHDLNNTSAFDLSKVTMAEILPYIVPGSYITFAGNAKSFLVEKRVEDKLLLSSYHYSKSGNVTQSGTLKNVFSEKFLWDIADQTQPLKLYVPKWATKNIQSLTNLVVKQTQQDASKSSKFSRQDSPEVVGALGDFLSNKYGITVNKIDNSNLQDFPDLDIKNSAAFVYKGEVFINLDKASIEEPLHELLHLVLMTMKSNNPERYYAIIQSIEDHPQFNTITSMYEGNVNAELLEETFVKLLSQTFRNKIIAKGIFTDNTFNNAITESISELFNLTVETEYQNAFDILGESVASIMSEFGSELLGNEEGLIDKQNVIKVLEVSGKIRSLLESGNLMEDCK